MSVKNPLSSLSRWKVLDNLRRSLVPIALVTLLLLGWIMLPAPLLWTLAVLGITFVPALAASAFDLLRKPAEAQLRHHLGTAMQAAGRRFASALFELACLPHEAFYCLDAIVRTAVRMLVTRRHLLQWTASSEVDRNASTSVLAFFRSMWIAPARRTQWTLCESCARSTGPRSTCSSSPGRMR